MDSLLFLDIDGVLNNHNKLGNGYCGIDRDKSDLLNEIISEVPSLGIVISSAWRYLIIRGDMTIKGFEYLLMVHGIHCYGKLHGHTSEDSNAFDGMVQFDPNHVDVKKWEKIGLTWRAKQINEYVAKHQPRKFAVIDDLGLDVPNFFRTDGKVGITKDHVMRIIEVLK